jgi:hypothetical protein
MVYPYCGEIFLRAVNCPVVHPSGPTGQAARSLRHFPSGHVCPSAQFLGAETYIMSQDPSLIYDYLCIYGNYIDNI